MTTDGEISLAGFSVGLGPVEGGAEVVINTPEAVEAIKSAGPALMEAVGTLLGFGTNSAGGNPTPGMQIPAPGGSQ